MGVSEATAGELRGQPVPRVTRAADIAVVSVPPLENGDRLTRSEFERRYAAMPEVEKAELIEG